MACRPISITPAVEDNATGPRCFAAKSTVACTCHPVGPAAFPQRAQLEVRGVGGKGRARGEDARQIRRRCRGACGASRVRDAPRTLALDFTSLTLLSENSCVSTVCFAPLTLESMGVVCGLMSVGGDCLATVPARIVLFCAGDYGDYHAGVYIRPCRRPCRRPRRRPRIPSCSSSPPPPRPCPPPRRPRQHKRAITTAGDHVISCRNHNKNIPCGL